MFEGVHNFSSFANAKNLWNLRIKNPELNEEEILKLFERKIERIEVKEVPTPITLAHLPIGKCFHYIDVTISGKSFLHNQVNSPC